jgi:hypothetical protein
VSPLHPLAWPRRAVALAAGLVLGGAVRDAPWVSLFAAALALLGHAVWALETPIAKAWPRSRRPQCAARLTLSSTVALALPWPGAPAVAALLVGASSGMLARDARVRVSPDGVVALAIGAALGATAAFLGGARAPSFVGLLGLVVSALATLSAVFRGGPGRTPVRPIDVVWLYVLGTLLALTLFLGR